MIIQDLIRYFSKFPDRLGVLDNFTRGSEKNEGYNALRAYIGSLDEPLLPEIKGFIVSSDERVIESRIRKLSSYFLLLEYAGLYSAPPNEAHIRVSQMNLSVIVAHPGNKSGMDVMDEALIMDKSLELITALAKQIDTDNKDLCSNRRYMPGSVSIQPVEPVMLYGCIGWALTMAKSEPLFNV